MRKFNLRSRPIEIVINMPEYIFMHNGGVFCSKARCLAGLINSIGVVQSISLMRLKFRISANSFARF